jgi:formylmethanofuran dehydrogenase subunit E-like metal-binding protein
MVTHLDKNRRCKMFERASKKVIPVGLVVLVTLSAVLLGGCAKETPVPPSPSIVSDYPGLEPLVDFVGEENLSVLHLVGFRAAERAIKDLSFGPGDPNILGLTDAGYIAQIGDYTSEKALDGVMMTAKLSRGEANLMNIHKPYNSPLWFAFFDKSSKDCVYLEAKSDILEAYLDKEQADREAATREFLDLKDGDIFSIIAKENIDADKLLSDPEPWQKKMEAQVFGGNEFSLITLCNLWAIGLPNDFMKAAELHDHICPGLTSGYFIAGYIKEVFPAEAPRHDYVVIAIPPWCKDDALIQIFETNVGHKRLFVKWLTKEQSKALPEEAKNVANIFVNTKTNEGIVVGFDWDKASKACEIERAWLKDFETYKWWWTRLKMDIVLMDYLDKPEEFVYTIKEFSTTPEQVEKLKAAGVNPLVELGIMPQQ